MKKTLLILLALGFITGSAMWADTSIQTSNTVACGGDSDSDDDDGGRKA